MGEIALAVAASHAPGLVGLFDKAPEESQRIVAAAYDEIGRQIRDANLDLIIFIANDHLADNRIGRYPDFFIGLAAEHRGPDEFFKDWLGVDDYTIPGAPDFGAKIFNGMNRLGVHAEATRENLRFDDNISIPVTRTGVASLGVPILPILQNVNVPPFPDQHRSYEVGQTIRRVIEQDLPEGTRVGLFGTGGLSHEPGGKRDFWIDEEFDRWFLDLLEEGDHEKVLREVTVERMDAAGAGGTAELLSWMVVLGAVGEGGANILGYTAWDQWRCGIGAVSWDVAPVAAPVQA